jgi:hypothetical protein
METETIDKLFLELSQVTKATTAKEVRLEMRNAELMVAIQPFADLVKSTSGRIPTERLSLADWHFLARTYDAAKKSQTTRKPHSKTTLNPTSLRY